jgi:glycosyltransferase involved in cell wall biosynthesis
VVGWHGSPYGLSLAETVRRAGLTDRVTLVPVVRDPTPWLFAADVFVNSSDIESLPRSILEAVSCGIPIAATDVFGAREMIVDGHSGWLYEPNDVDALTAALVRVLETDPARRRTLAAAAYAGLRDWLDPTLYAHDYSEVLTEIAAGGGTDDWEHR